MSESGDLFSEIEEDKKVKKTYDPRVFSSNRKLKVTALLEDEGKYSLYSSFKVLGARSRNGTIRMNRVQMKILRLKKLKKLKLIIWPRNNKKKLDRMIIGITSKRTPNHKIIKRSLQ